MALPVLLAGGAGGAATLQCCFRGCEISVDLLPMVCDLLVTLSPTTGLAGSFRFLPCSKSCCGRLFSSLQETFSEVWVFPAD